MLRLSTLVCRGADGPLRALVELIDETRRLPHEFAFVVSSPLLLRHVSRRGDATAAGSPAYQWPPSTPPPPAAAAAASSWLGEICTPARSLISAHFLSGDFEGLLSRYDPSGGGALEIGTLAFDGSGVPANASGVLPPNVSPQAVARPVLSDWNVSAAMAALATLEGAGWLTPRGLARPN